MAAGVHKALGDDCSDRGQKRKMGEVGKYFHSLFNNLRIVSRGSDVVGIITRSFSLFFPFSGLFSFSLSLPVMNMIMGQRYNSQGISEMRTYNAATCFLIMKD